MKYKLTLLILIMLLSLSGLQAQVSQQWVSRYNGLSNSDDELMYSVIDGSGNVYVTGYNSSSSDDIITVKYNSSGQEQWVATFNGPGNSDDYPSAICVDMSGNVYVNGGSYIGGNLNYETIKYNSAGIQQWVVTITGFMGADILSNSMVVDGSGNSFLNIESTGGNKTIKLNTSGQIVWMTSGYNGYPNSISIDSSGNVYVTGNRFPDVFTKKYNPAGQQQWEAIYNGPANSYDFAEAITTDKSGNVYVTGSSYNSNANEDFLTIKYNSSGLQQWAATYNGPADSNDYSYSIAVDESGNVYVNGTRDVIQGRTIADYTTIKYNSSGIEQWVRTYNGTGNSSDYSGSVVLDAIGNIYVTGGSTGLGTGRDWATIKYNPLGEQQWVARYNGPGNGDDGAGSIKVDASGNVYVSGISKGAGTGDDFTTIKYSQLTGVSQNFGSNPDKFSLSQNYPNPFNPITIIRYSITENSFTTLKVYDLLGNEAATLVNERQNAGSYSIDFNASNLSSGIYFYKLQAGDFVETKRMTLIK